MTSTATPARAATRVSPLPPYRPPQTDVVNLPAGAVIAGINYVTEPSFRLRGCCNDARAMAQYLRANGVRIDALLVDEDASGDVYTPASTRRAALLAAITALALRSHYDRLATAIIHYSGHGTQMLDDNGDETADGLDEAIVPGDARRTGCVRDDELLTWLRAFHPGTTVFVVTDCCHSGSVLDLPYAYDDNGLSVRSGGAVRPAGWPKIVCLSGCRDEQVSLDVWDPARGRMQGAMTAALLDVLYRCATVSARAQPTPLVDLWTALRTALRAGGYAQRPVLSANFDLVAGRACWLRAQL